MGVTERTVLFVCTGNAARSVMAATMLRAAAQTSDTLVRVESAGTHSIPDLPMSTRTRSALATHGLADVHHRSAQLDEQMVAEAAMIVIFEPMHLRYMRKKHAAAANKVGSLHRLARDLASGDIDTLPQRLADLHLGENDFEPWEEVIDPAGGDLAVFESSVAEISELMTALIPRIGLVARAGS